MARNMDELDEMLVPQDHSTDLEDEVKAPKPKKQKKSDESKPPRQLEKEAAKRKETVRTIAIVVLCFVLILGALIGVGVLMSERAGTGGNGDVTTVEKAQPAPGKTYFKSDVEPELSAEGVKGRLKEAYYTIDGDLAVTLRLSNGLSTDQELVKLSIRIFNGDDQTIAEQTIERFRPACTVTAGGYSDYYFEIAKKNVALADDSLKELGTTLEIGSKTAKDGNKDGQQSDGKGPKDIAPGRTYYENTGNLPELSAEGVKASIIRARYTNDGSLAVTLSLSNGTDVKQQVSMIDFLLQNGEGATIANYKFDQLETPCFVESQSYTEYDLIVDAPYVALQDDSLATLACTISVAAAGVE